MVNVGNLDRWVRIILGLVLLVVPFVPAVAAPLGGPGGWLLVLPAVGVVLILTALFRFCPAYRLLGLSSCPLKRPTLRS